MGKEIKAHGMSFPMKAVQSGLITHHMTAKNKRVFTYNIKPLLGKPLKVHFIASNKDVANFLRDGENLDLSNYDLSLGTGGANSNFFISAQKSVLKEQWSRLNQALDMEPRLDRFTGETPSFGKDADYGFIGDLAEDAVNVTCAKLLESSISDASLNSRYKFWKKKRPVQEIDIIQDYGNVITYYLVEKFVGLTVEGKDLSSKAKKLRFMMGPMFFNLFINPGAKRPLISWVSNLISKKYKRQILKCYETASPDTLLGRLKRLEPQYSPEKISEHQTYAANIIMEIAGSVHFLTGSGFAGIIKSIDELEDLPKEEPGISNTQFCKIIDRVSENPREKIDEYLRHNSPTDFIFRTARKDFTINTLISSNPTDVVNIKKGDLLCLLTGFASKDNSVFSNPGLNEPNQSKCLRHKYLHFGSPDINPAKRRSLYPDPSAPHHPCFGQYWARAILHKMLLGLRQFDGIHTETRGQFKSNPLNGGTYKMRIRPSNLPSDKMS